MNIYSIDAEKVLVKEGRQRKKFDLPALRDLSRSIEKYGQLQPGICIKTPDGTVQLVFGERRLRACKMIKRDFEYVLRSDIDDPILLKQIELEENTQREQLSWQERTDAKLELHEFMQENPNEPVPGQRLAHRIEDTSEMLGESRGLTSQDLELAMFSREIPEVRDAKTKTEAKKIIKRMKEGYLRKEALEKALGDETTIDLDELSPGESSSEKQDEALLKKMLIEYDKRTFCGSFEDIAPKLKPNSYQIVIFDPPWGVDFDKVMKKTGGTLPYEDLTTNFDDKLELWLTLIYDLMSDDSHLYMVFAIANYSFVYETIEEVGFNTNGIPLIWHKRGAHRTRNPEIWPGRSYEPIVYARKGKKKLARQGQPDIITTPMPTPKLKQDHPSAKHPDLIRDLLQRSGYPGDRLLDPMAGSGMTGVAAESLAQELSLDWTLCEQESTFHDLIMYNLVRGYHKIVEDQSVPEATSYKELEPGTAEWTLYWDNHPEQQEEMLAWKKSE